ANAGLSLVPSPNVSWRMWPVARSSTLMSYPGPLRDAYAISLNGAGDHVGLSQYDSDVFFDSPVPSAAIMLICGAPERAEANVVRAPVGRRVGEMSMPVCLVSRRTLDPSRLAT